MGAGAEKSMLEEGCGIVNLVLALAELSAEVGVIANECRNIAGLAQLDSIEERTLEMPCDRDTEADKYLDRAGSSGVQYDSPLESTGTKSGD
jgi:hypothetical protein